MTTQEYTAIMEFLKKNHFNAFTKYAYRYIDSDLSVIKKNTSDSDDEYQNILAVIKKWKEDNNV